MDPIPYPSPGEAHAAPSLTHRRWVNASSEELVQQVATAVAGTSIERIASIIDELVDWNRQIHETEGINLNPAANAMNPRAEALLSSGVGVRPSLGHPGAKYEMGLEAIERIEVVAAELAARVFHAPYAEVRVGSGALANLYAFMSCASPGDAIIAPPATIGGHVTHHTAGAAGLYELDVHAAPIDAGAYTLDIDALAQLADQLQPKVISVGGSLNLGPHDVGAVRSIADQVGAKVLFDAAHLSGLIAGGAWPNPLDAGAHLMTMSTYKSFGGPPSGLLLSTDAELAERIDAIAFPGLTANFDVAKTAALAMTLLDWLDCGQSYADSMVTAAVRLADELEACRASVHRLEDGSATCSHALALEAGELGGHATAEHLRRANLLTSAIGLPDGPDAGVRIGTNELVRWGATDADMPELAQLIADALVHPEPEALAPRTREWRQRFDQIHFVQGGPVRPNQQ